MASKTEVQGVVVSDKMQKSVVVAVERRIEVGDGADPPAGSVGGTAARAVRPVLGRGPVLAADDGGAVGDAGQDVERVPARGRLLAGVVAALTAHAVGSLG